MTSSPTTHLTWTPRGVAVLVCLVLAVVAVLTITVVVAFLGVSNDAPPSQLAPVAMTAVTQAP